MKNPPIKACYVFPGQGSQSVGMGKYIYNKYESAREIFDTGNKILKPDLKFNITDLMFGGPEELLMETKYCQSSIFLNNVAHYFVLNEKIDCVLTLGHSIGEYSALVASGALSLEDGIKLVNIRAKLMSECIPKKTIKRDISHHMAAVLTDNLDLTYKKTIDSINEACEVGSSDGGRVQIANINSSSQIIISGNENAVIRAVEYLKNKGIKKIVYLKVEGPFHSELMKPAAEDMKKVLNGIEIKKPTILYIANSTGDFISEPDKIKESLVEQIYKTVEWKKSLETAIQNGFTTFVESGSGEKQYNLLNRNYKNINVLDVKNYVN